MSQISPTDPDRKTGSSRPRRLLAGVGATLAPLMAAGFVWVAADTPGTKAEGVAAYGTAPAPRGVTANLTAPAAEDVADGTGSWAEGIATSISLASASFPGPNPTATATAVRQDCDPYYAMEADPRPHRNFYFARGIYSQGGFGYGRSWSVDFPKADRQFSYVMERTLGWDIYPCETPVQLDDPLLRKYPFLYMLEVGAMGLTNREVEGFRDYLLAGGFAFIDDFWGQYEWANFEREIRRVLPDHEIEEIPLDHMIFRIVYPIAEVLQVPNRGNGSTQDPRFYSECRDGTACTPTVRGIFDEGGRLMVLITHNSDLGDAWEWAEDPRYPYDRSNYAFSLAFNAITYAMTY